MLTDRNDLDDQLFDTFAGCQQLLRQDPQQADNRDRVRQLLNTNSGGIIFTTVQKFSPADGESLYPKISDRANIIVLADEAHRSQYGFTAKQVDIKDENGNIIGKATRYGFAKYIRDPYPMLALSASQAHRSNKAIKIPPPFLATTSTFTTSPKPLPMVQPSPFITKAVLLKLTSTKQVVNSSTN